jgi:hypothetical protein
MICVTIDNDDQGGKTKQKRDAMIMEVVGKEYQISARWRCFSDMAVSDKNAPIIK